MLIRFSSRIAKIQGISFSLFREQSHCVRFLDSRTWTARFERNFYDGHARHVPLWKLQKLHCTLVHSRHDRCTFLVDSGSWPESMLRLRGQTQHDLESRLGSAVITSTVIRCLNETREQENRFCSRGGTYTAGANVQRCETPQIWGTATCTCAIILRCAGFN